MTFLDCPREEETHIFVRHLAFGRDLDVKDEFLAAALRRRHAEVMDGFAQLVLVHDGLHLRACTLSLGIVRDDGIHVDGHDDAILPAQKFLNAVDDLVRFEEVHRGGYLGVYRSEDAPRAIVVDDDVMHACDRAVLEHRLLDSLDERGIGRLPEERLQRVARRLPAAMQNEERDEDARPAVDVDSRRIMEREAGDDDDGRDAVVQTVRRRRTDRRRVNALADRLVEAAEPELQRDGRREDHEHRNAHLGRFWRENLLDGSFQ